MRETLILSGSVQYNDFKGQVGIDEHTAEAKRESPLYQCDDDKVVIGWQIGKYEYDAPVRVKILSVENSHMEQGRIADDATIYVKETNLSVEDFINNLGRIEITALLRNSNEQFGKTFKFEYENS